MMRIQIGDKEFRVKGVALEAIKASSEFLSKFYGVKYNLYRFKKKQYAC
jgi:hypothetical protein